MKLISVKLDLQQLGSSVDQISTLFKIEKKSRTEPIPKVNKLETFYHQSQTKIFWLKMVPLGQMKVAG